MTVKTSMELKLDAEAAQLALNTALNEDSYSGIAQKQDALKKVVGEYNKKVKLENFAILRNDENPMLAAIEKLTYGTMKIKAEHDKETKTVIRYLLEADEAYIDLLDFEKFCDGVKTIAADTSWKYKLEKYNFVMALRVAKELGDDVKTVEKRYHISEEAMGIDKENRPISNTKMLSGLQSIVDAIIYEDKDGKNLYKVTSHNVAFLVQTLTKEGKTKHGVAYANASTTRRLIAKILNCIIDGSGTHKLEYATKRDVENETDAKK
jgi:hypothetical protein